MWLGLKHFQKAVEALAHVIEATEVLIASLLNFVLNRLNRRQRLGGVVF